MAYSHSRLRKVLAIARILTGFAFVSAGAFKVSSLEFAKILFPDFLDAAILGGSVSWMRPVLQWIVSFGPGRVGVTIGFVELFIGIAMVLGLAVRPASLIGMLYTGGLFLVTFHEEPGTPPVLRSGEYPFLSLFPFLVFLMLGVGHAGETWGLGSLYHHHRARLWVRETERALAPNAPAEEQEAREEPKSFEEFLAQEEAAAEATESAWASLPSPDAPEG